MDEETSNELPLSLTEVLGNQSPMSPADFAKKYKALKKAQAELDAIEDLFKAKLIEQFELGNVAENSVVIEGIKFTYVKSSVRNSVDSKKLLEEEPTIYNKFLKASNVKSTIKTTVEY